MPIARTGLHLLSAVSLTTSALAGTPAWSAPRALSAPVATLQAPACSTAAIAAMTAGGDVTITKAEQDGAAGPCQVEGMVVTRGEGAPDGSARFQLNLPANWNRKLLFLGGGGFDGNVPKAPADRLAAGYATLATDSGHEQNPGYPSDGTDAS